MNNTPAAEETTTPPDSARDFTSDHESVSPAASGYSDQQDPGSSADTTPPPQSEVFNVPGASYRSASKRHSSGSGFSRSYQSTHSLVPASLPNEPYSLGHSRHVSYERGPSSGGQDDKDLAAAVELLSCSLGSSNGAAVTSHMVSLSDAPPVPPLPARYLDQATTPFLIGSFPANAPESFTRGDARRRAAAATAAERDVKMEEGTETSSVMEDDDDGDDMRSRARSDEDDDGVFGRMDE